MTEHTPPTAHDVIYDALHDAYRHGVLNAQSHSFADAIVAALRSSGVLPPDRPGAHNTIEWWRDLANNNQRQLDIVDDALGWKEYGGGRIACVEELKRRSGVLPETPSAAQVFSSSESEPAALTPEQRAAIDLMNAHPEITGAQWLALAASQPKDA